MITAEEVLARFLEDQLGEFPNIDLHDVNQRGISGDRPLHVAAVRGDPEEVEALLAGGADVNAAGDMNKTPIHYAIGLGHSKIVELLLKAGADVKMVSDFGTNAMDRAKEVGNSEILRLVVAFDKSTPRTV